MSPGKCQAPDPCPNANQFGAARAGASRRRRLDVEVEPVGGKVQLGRRLGTQKRDPVVPDDPGIGPTHPDEATLVGAEFPEAPWGQPGGAGVKGPPRGEDEPLAGTSNAPRVPDVGLQAEVERRAVDACPGPGQGISRPSLSGRRGPSGPTPGWPRGTRGPSGRRSPPLASGSLGRVPDSVRAAQEAAQGTHPALVQGGFAISRFMGTHPIICRASDGSLSFGTDGERARESEVAATPESDFLSRERSSAQN